MLLSPPTPCSTPTRSLSFLSLSLSLFLFSSIFISSLFPLSLSLFSIFISCLFPLSLSLSLSSSSPPFSFPLSLFPSFSHGLYLPSPPYSLPCFTSSQLCDQWSSPGLLFPPQVVEWPTLRGCKIKKCQGCLHVASWSSMHTTCFIYSFSSGREKRLFFRWKSIEWYLSVYVE